MSSFTLLVLTSPAACLAPPAEDEAQTELFVLDSSEDASESDVDYLSRVALLLCKEEYRVASGEIPVPDSARVAEVRERMSIHSVQVRISFFCTQRFKVLTLLYV